MLPFRFHSDSLSLSFRVTTSTVNCLGSSNSTWCCCRCSFGITYSANIVLPAPGGPIRNKRETFRILKHTLIGQDNISESIQYKVSEKQALSQELELEESSWQNSLNRANLWFNWVSNRHGDSYWQAVKFTAVTGILCYWTSLVLTDEYCLFCLENITLRVDDWFGGLFQFLLPTHKSQYLGVDFSYNMGFYIFDFLGRLLVGYGIYQFIQAFRKYR